MFKIFFIKIKTVLKYVYNDFFNVIYFEKLQDKRHYLQKSKFFRDIQYFYIKFLKILHFGLVT